MKAIGMLLVLSFFALAAVPVTAQPQQPDILTFAASNPNLSILTRAINAAGLKDELMGTGPFTLFAPTNKAFERLPKAFLNDLLRPENRDQLRSVLLYHVAQGRVMSSDVNSVVSPSVLTTLGGSALRLTHGAAGVTVGPAMILQPDIMTSNGVVHVIDRVLIPPTIIGTTIQETTTPVIITPVPAPRY